MPFIDIKKSVQYRLHLAFSETNYVSGAAQITPYGQTTLSL